MTVVTAQQICEIYRVLLLRDPEPEALVRWQKSGMSFAELRNGIMACEEFTSIQSRISASAIRISHSKEIIRTKLSRIFNLVEGNPQGHAPTSALLQQMVVSFFGCEHMSLVVAVGGADADDLACYAASNAGCVVLSLNAGDARPGLTRVPFSISGLISVLDSCNAAIGLAVVGSEIPTSDVVTLYQNLPETAAMLCVEKTSSETRNALNLEKSRVWGETLVSDGYFLVTRAVWPFPVTYPKTNSNTIVTCDSKIALAAIIKNEQEELPGMLLSCVGLIDRVILLDTGSTDETLSIAYQTLNSMNVKYDIHQAPFSDFAQARNALIDAVPAEIDWVLMLDADERLTAEDAAGLAHLATREEAVSYVLPRYNILDESEYPSLGRYPDRQARFFKICGSTKPYYVNPVHEALIVSGPSGFPPVNQTAFGGTAGGPHIHHRVFAKRAAHDQKQTLYAKLAAD